MYNELIRLAEMAAKYGFNLEIKKAEMSRLVLVLTKGEIKLNVSITDWKYKKGLHWHIMVPMSDQLPERLYKNVSCHYNRDVDWAIGSDNPGTITSVLRLYK